MILNCFIRISNVDRLSPVSLSLYIRRKFSCKSPRGPPWSILFFGTDNFALYSLKAVWAKFNTGTLISDLAVVGKQGCLVRKFAESEGLTVYDWPLKVKDIESKYHIGMVVSFGNLIPDYVIKSLPLGCVNVHASLLPRWRGAAPIIYAVSHGDMETGITLMKIRPYKFDTGEIIRQYRLSIDPSETAKDLENKLGVCGSNLLMECIRDLPRCLDMAIPQPNYGVTYAPKVKSSMSLIDWRRMSALNVFNLHRALQHIYPLTTRWHDHLVKLHHILLEKVYSDQTCSSTNSSEESLKNSALSFLSSLDGKTEKQSSPSTLDTKGGQLLYDKRAKQLKVCCADGNYVIVKKLSLSGKTMSASDFYNGYMSKKINNEWKFNC